MRIPETIIQEINDRLSIEQIIGDYVSLKRQGSRYFGLCPFHSEKTPSFSVDPEKKLFHCYGCKKGGTMFTFVMEMEKATFPEAAEILAKKAGIAIEQQSPADIKRELVKKNLIELYNRVSGSFHYILKEKSIAKTAMEYLLKRGLTDEILDKYEIGFSPKEPDWIYNFLLKKNYSHAFLADSGLFSKKYPAYSIFTNRIMFPIKNIHGDTIAFGGRSLTDRGPKYINSPDTILFRKGDALYGLSAALGSIRENGSFILVEGYMDVLALYTAGVMNVVAPLGTSFTENQARILKRYVNKGVILLDSDKAGVEATKRAITVCQNTGIEADVINLKGGKDPAEILQKEGPQALNNSIIYTINSFEFLLQKALSEYDNSTPEGKEGISKLLFPYIRNTQSAVIREGYFKQLSEILDIDYSSILKDYEVNNRKEGTIETRPVARKTEDLDSELYLLFAVSVNFEYFKQVRSQIRYEDLENKEAKELYIALEEMFRKDDNSMDTLLFSVENDELRNKMQNRLASGEFTINQEKVINDATARVKQNILEKKRKNITKSLKTAESEGSRKDLIRKLLEEKMYLDSELSKLRIKS